MKKILFMSLIMLFALMGHAQKNAIKLGLFSTQIGDFNVNYERVLTETSSLNFNIGYWDFNSAFIDGLEYMPSSSPDDIQFLKFKGSMHTAIDYRMYMGQKGAMRGFYLAPYIRYWGQGMEMSDIMYSDTYRNQFSFDIDAKINSFGAGIQVGFQWIIRKHINLDLYFMGIGIERMTIKAKFSSKYDEMVYNSETDEEEHLKHKYFEDSVEDAIKDIKLISNKAEIETTDDYLSVKVPLWLPGLRAGFSIGYSF